MLTISHINHEHLHELTMLYINNKNLISTIQNPEELGKIYFDVSKEIDSTYKKLDEALPKQPQPKRKQGVINKGIEF